MTCLFFIQLNLTGREQSKFKQKINQHLDFGQAVKGSSNHIIEFICVPEFHYKSSFMCFVNAIIKRDSVMSVGVVHLDLAAESVLLTPQ